MIKTEDLLNIKEQANKLNAMIESALFDAQKNSPDMPRPLDAKSYSYLVGKTVKDVEGNKLTLGKGIGAMVAAHFRNYDPLAANRIDYWWILKSDVREKLNKKGLTNITFDVTQDTFNGWLNHSGALRKETADKIAKALGVRIEAVASKVQRSEILDLIS